MASIQNRPAALPISPPASFLLHLGFVVTGVVTTLLGPILPMLIAKWSLTDQRAGLFFTAQFCGSMLGVASIGWLIPRGYRYAFVCGYGLIAVGMIGLSLNGYYASLAAAALFGCGLGQSLSSTNLWVAEVFKSRRVAALSILNVMWGVGAIASSPLVLLAQRRHATPFFLYALAASAALIGLLLIGMNLQPDAASPDQDQSSAPRSESLSMRSAVSLAVLFFLYIGCENSVAGWVAALAKRMRPDSGQLWTLAPMFFWGGLLAGRALVPLVPLRRGEKLLLSAGLLLSAIALGFLLRAGTFPHIALCLTASGLGFAAIYPILVAWMVKSFGERSRRLGAINFALAGFGGATMPWFVGLASTETGSLRAGLLVPLIACLVMLALIPIMREPVFGFLAARAVPSQLEIIPAAQSPETKSD
jgi:MFS transporter, FHS family, glucose/mannose:H+ symporter